MIIDGDTKVIAAAFIKARGEMASTVTKDAKGNFGKYATLAAIVEASSEHFANHGLAIVQEASVEENGVCVETWLVHESGSLMRFTPLVMPLLDKKPQAIGSAITYARRYALGSICGLAPEDDDGQAAQQANVVVNRPKPVSPKVEPATLPSPNPKAVAAHDVNPFGDERDDVEFAKPAKVDPRTDEEDDIISMWQSSEDAYVWAVNVGACDNKFEAGNSMKKVARENNLSFSVENKPAIFLAFLRHQNEKLASLDTDRLPEAA